ncbi:conjugal transfer protein TraH [Neisseria brasiliensis]|uniref:conjugal transfer protein TraH n=1 Tax=Neisseria TaxID=482 RepID=UPI000C26E1DB|nr:MULTISPECIES: conjugal transfer protein TraH [Neisseria]PJO79160.1 conjugal transfer protein TraH [Neisseria sp. N177_16]QGL26281.1 conjugal transfer protein TraH [Neisseria brasiliensis]
MKIQFIKSPKLPAKLLAICLSATKYLVLSVSLTVPVHTHAGIESDMANMFNSMGAATNYTEAGAFHGQSGSLYTGGSFSARAPVSNLSLGNIQLPSVNAGCGGIDIFGGSFSFVSKEEFIQFTRNLGNNAAGVAFDLALKALDPMIQDAINGIRDLAQSVNSHNMNSCQMAQSLVGGVMGAVAESASSNCQAAAVSSGSADDASDASWFCRYGKNLARVSKQAAGTNSPQDTISFTGGNLTYEAMKKHTSDIKDLDLGNFDAMDFYYSIAGTAVFPTPKEDGEGTVSAGVQSFAPRITGIGELLSGKENSVDKQYVTVDMWTCRDGSERKKEICSEKNNVQIKSLRYIVRERLKAMPAKIRSNANWTEQEVREVSVLVANSSLPILRMAVADAFLGTKNLEKTAVTDTIAIDVAAGILSSAERHLRTAVSLYSKTDEVSGIEAKKIMDNLAELRGKIYAERNHALAKIEIEQSMMSAMAQSDSQWRSQFVDSGRSMAFDQMNRL